MHLVGGSFIGSKGLLIAPILVCWGGGRGQATTLVLATLWHVALNALPYPATTTAAEG